MIYVVVKCPSLLSLSIQEDQISCLTRGSNRTGEHGITVRFGGAERHLQGLVYHYTPNPNITMAAPSKSFLRWALVSDFHYKDLIYAHVNNPSSSTDLTD